MINLIRNKMDLSDKELVESMIDRKVSELMEMCDTVQIIITKHESATNTTWCLSKGAGNVYARVASCDDWIGQNSL